MLADTLTLNGRTGADQSFRRISSADAIKRIAPTRPLSEPLTLEVKHTQQGTGVNAVDRHLVSAVLVKTSAAGIVRKATVNFTVAMPLDGTISNNDVYDLVAYVIDYLSTGGFSATTGFAALTNLDDFILGGG